MTSVTWKSPAMFALPPLCATANSTLALVIQDKSACEVACILAPHNNLYVLPAVRVNKPVPVLYGILPEFIVLNNTALLTVKTALSTVLDTDT